MALALPACYLSVNCIASAQESGSESDSDSKSESEFELQLKSEWNRSGEVRNTQSRAVRRVKVRGMEGLSDW